ncbi:MAG: GH92 family glycosyl hydrolase, partial [Stackebrandtia sp.]
MSRHRTTQWITVLACSVLGLALVPAGQAAAADGTEYATSFEDGQPLPDWEDSVEGDKTGGLESTMTSARGTGPAESPTAKEKVGYTGTRSAKMSGKHTVSGRGYSYNKLLDTDIEVTETSELSYLVFPVFVEDAPANPSTFVAVDLAFTDGTYLSELGAVDQHGAKLDPTSQGESETLYTDQWNRKAVPLGKVAAGKTVDRVLLAYDNPKGPAEFTDFFDDISVVGEPEAPDADSPADHVLTTRGTQASGDFSRGNNFPATGVPHGFNFYTPVTDAGSTSWLYQYHRANNADNRPELQAFSVSHEPSPWMGDRQTFQVMPSTASKTPDADREKRALSFGHDKEIAKPHHYGVMFDNGISTDIAPASHSGLFRFSFPDDNANLIFDNVTGDGGLSLNKSDNTVTGYSDVKSGLSTGATRMFMYAEFDDSAVAGEKLPGGGGENVAGYLRFDAGDDRTVQM